MSCIPISFSLLDLPGDETHKMLNFDDSRKKTNIKEVNEDILKPGPCYVGSGVTCMRMHIYCTK